VPELLVRLRPDAPKDEKLSFSNAVMLSRLPQHLQTKSSQLIIGKKLGFREVRHLIQKTASSAGIRITRASYSPRDDYRRFNGFLNRTKADANLFVAKPANFFVNMFLNRASVDRKGAIGEIEEIISHLDSLVETLKKS
jgi:hypothetical protein